MTLSLETEDDTALTDDARNADGTISMHPDRAAKTLTMLSRQDVAFAVVMLFGEQLARPR